MPVVVKSVFFRSSIVTNVKDNGCVHICHGSIINVDVTGLGLIKKHCCINLNMPFFNVEMHNITIIKFFYNH